jgi:hypothetical protein
MLNFKPKSFFTWQFSLGDSGTIGLDHWYPRGQASFQGEEWQIERENRCSGKFIISRNGRIEAEAARTAVFWRRFEITFGKRTFVLQRLNWLGMSMRLLEEGKPVGTIKRLGVIGRQGQADFDPSIPEAVQIISLWLTLWIWRRIRHRSH